MLSHLRFHRRAPSNPTSPVPDQLSSWEATAIHDHPQTAQDVSSRPDTRPRSSNSAQLPPVLPPIPRVTSADSELSFPTSREDARPVSQDSRPPPLTRPGQNAASSGFIGGIALQNRMAAQTPGAQQSPQPAPQENLISRSKPPPPPINTGLTSRPTPVNKSSSFVTPTDLAQNPGIAGKRPAGARMASEPATSTTASETHKGKRGLPFLKNPMSGLLSRRKTTQPTPELQPLPSITEPAYDPRIKGTKVHDFSAPRPKRAVPSRDPANTTSPSVIPPGSDPDRPQSVGEQNGEPGSRAPQPSVPFDPHVVADLEKKLTKPSELDPASAEAEQFSVRKPDRPPPPVPEKDVSSGSVHTSSSTTSRTYSVETSVMPRTTSSRRTAVSNHPSISRASTRASVMSSIPKHMKSTSSRFSFDMIGSASQEKILEERHRQREQERKTSDGAAGPRDSRFDEFDEDLDYDAMMDDDGLEERIPGVNADYEDEYDDYGAEQDPDNDQENFSGFVFQRSNPASSLASPNTPGMLATPRDANGKVIGFAVTKDATPELPPTASPLYLHQNMTFPGQEPSGLGIEQLHISGDEKVADTQLSLETGYQTFSLEAAQPRTTQADELYFDDGLADELDFENDDPPFDESIFDNVDTDQYGRPIPGAFAQAQEAMRAAQQQQASKRESDDLTTSQFSGPSGAAQSTAHTSLSAGLQVPAADDDKAAGDEQPQPQHVVSTIPGQDLLYQAALAAAAQKAAASGKFNRRASPPLPTEVTITSPTDSSESFQPSGLDQALDDYDDDTNVYNPNDYEAEDDYNQDDYESAGQYAAYIDDDDFDDEVIAEANASALANDSDGFYGQEFGFYSAPLSQPHQGHSHQSSTSSNLSVKNVPLSAENLFQYANGGYFGPSGAGLYRSKSGRVVSREPNLTPITERSEYSNRNSVMSLALPPVIGSEGGAGGRSSSAGIPSSPGLAQLALLPSDDDNMSMSALMRLRSKAWGGSQASGLSSREGSPRSERAAFPSGGIDGASSPFGGGSFGSGLPYQHTRKNSAFSLWSATSDVPSESGPGSPTITGSNMLIPQPQPTNAPSGFSSPLASSPFPPPDATQPLFIPPVPSGPLTGLGPVGVGVGVYNGGNNICSPVLENEGEEAEFDDWGDDQDRTLTARTGGMTGVHFPSQPNPLYPQWSNTPVQAQIVAATRLGVMGGPPNANGNTIDGGNRLGLSLQTATNGIVSGGSGSRPTSPSLMRRPASAGGISSSTGFGANNTRPGSGMGHRHKGSADSISYVREDVGANGAAGGAGHDGEMNGAGGGAGATDAFGSSGGVSKTRWVMERRRTDESTGEVEILGREVVEAGRI